MPDDRRDRYRLVCQNCGLDREFDVPAVPWPSSLSIETARALHDAWPGACDTEDHLTITILERAY